MKKITPQIKAINVKNFAVNFLNIALREDATIIARKVCIVFKRHQLKNAVSFIFLSFQNLPGKLVLTEHKDLSSYGIDYLALVLHMAVLKYMLNNIVAILVLNQALCVIMELSQYWISLLWFAVLQDALDHTASIRVG